MKLYAFPPSSRSLAITAVIRHLELECELVPIDLRRGEHHAPEHAARNANRKVPALDDAGYMLWESNAILFYLAAKRPESGLWPADARGQADVLRWLCWESAHWDAESIGMVTFEHNSRRVLGLGAADPAFVARGEQNFARFAAVLDESLARASWLACDRLTLADFSVAGLVPTAQRLALPLAQFSHVVRWYERVAALPAWRDAALARDAAMAALLA